VVIIVNSKGWKVRGGRCYRDEASYVSELIVICDKRVGVYMNHRG
jgi:hypothetical protein